MEPSHRREPVDEPLRAERERWDRNAEAKTPEGISEAKTPEELAAALRPSPGRRPGRPWSTDDRGAERLGSQLAAVATGWPRAAGRDGTRPDGDRSRRDGHSAVEPASPLARNPGALTAYSPQGRQIASVAALADIAVVRARAPRPRLVIEAIGWREPLDLDGSSRNQLAVAAGGELFVVTPRGRVLSSVSGALPTVGTPA